MKIGAAKKINQSKRKIAKKKAEDSKKTKSKQNTL